jgi:CBS domain-containing protein
MRAADIMTTNVVSVGPDTPADEIARRLLEHGISAVPVVDDSGAAIGMVSEGDLIGRNDAEREARRDWWLTLLAEGESLSPEFLRSLRTRSRTARELMTAPLVTIDENTDIAEIARLLVTYRIKRVPVMRDGRVVGIVSRADLLRAQSASQARPLANHHGGFLAAAFASIDEHFRHGAHPHAAQETVSGSQPAAAFSADDFRRLVMDFGHNHDLRRQTALQAELEMRRARVKELVANHIGDEGWNALLDRARQAAEHGSKELMLLRFPGQLCSDGGRAINAPEPDWPKTLRGEAAEIYLRWERELKPRGFRLAARVLEFPGGVPGDIGLFLVWEA